MRSWKRMLNLKCSIIKQILCEIKGRVNGVLINHRSKNLGLSGIGGHPSGHEFISPRSPQYTPFYLHSIWIPEPRHGSNTFVFNVSHGGSDYRYSWAGWALDDFPPGSHRSGSLRNQFREYSRFRFLLSTSKVYILGGRGCICSRLL